MVTDGWDVSRLWRDDRPHCLLQTPYFLAAGSFVSQRCLFYLDSIFKWHHIQILGIRGKKQKLQLPEILKRFKGTHILHELSHEQHSCPAGQLALFNYLLSLFYLHTDNPGPFSLLPLCGFHLGLPSGNKGSWLDFLIYMWAFLYKVYFKSFLIMPKIWSSNFKISSMVGRNTNGSGNFMLYKCDELIYI